jgi:RNA polymerase sigma-70 factor (ECF subfamily)
MARQLEAGGAADAAGAGAPSVAPSVELAAGDPAALGARLRDLQPRMTAVALRFTRDRDSAHDVVQNAYEKVFRHRHQFRGQARLSTWVHRIVANEALMWLRSERRRARFSVALEEVEDAPPRDPTPAAWEILARRQRLEVLQRGVAALAPEERDVIRCCAIEGRSYAEYGAERGIHPAAAKSRAFRARQRLSRRLERSP